MNAFSQTESGFIVFKRNKMVQNGKVLDAAKLKTILSSNPASVEAYTAYKKNGSLGYSFLLTGVVFECTGAALLLSETIKEAKEVDEGNLSHSEKYQLSLALMGLGLVGIVVGVPFNTRARKAFVQSINDYNGSLKSSRYQPVEFNVLISCNRVGLVMRF